MDKANLFFSRSKMRSQRRMSQKLMPKPEEVFICYWCEEELPVEEFSRDHMKPVCFGGESIADNLVASCKFCNTIRGAVTAMLVNTWVQYRQLDKVRYYLEEMAPKDTWVRQDQIEFLKKWAGILEDKHAKELDRWLSTFQKSN